MIQQHCAGCGCPLPVEAQFCPGCGHAVNALAQPLRSAVPNPQRASFESNWSDVKLVGWLFGLLLFVSFVVGLVSKESISPWPGTVASCISAVIVIIFAGIRYRDISRLFSFPQLSGRTTLEMVEIALLFVVVMATYFTLIQRVGVPTIGVTSEYLRSGWHVTYMILLISLMPAIFEELAFRGVIQSALERVVDVRQALLIQAALFSVLHLLPMMFPSHFVMGLCLGYMRLRSRSLYPGILLHATWNSLVLFNELYWS